MEKIKILMKKILKREVILYLVFGVLSTIVNFVTFFVLAHLIGLEENTSNAIAILFAILFAYVTNSIWVFNSNLNWKEFFKFMLGRAFTFFVEFFGFFVMFNLIHIPDLISKITITVVVVILNFFLSKYFAFKKKK